MAKKHQVQCSLKRKDLKVLNSKNHHILYWHVSSSLPLLTIYIHSRSVMKNNYS